MDTKIARRVIIGRPYTEPIQADSTFGRSVPLLVTSISLCATHPSSTRAAPEYLELGQMAFAQK